MALQTFPGYRTPDFRGKFERATKKGVSVWDFSWNANISPAGRTYQEPFAPTKSQLAEDNTHTKLDPLSILHDFIAAAPFASLSRASCARSFVVCVIQRVWEHYGWYVQPQSTLAIYSASCVSRVFRCWSNYLNHVGSVCSLSRLRMHRVSCLANWSDKRSPTGNAG